MRKPAAIERKAKSTTLTIITGSASWTNGPFASPKKTILNTLKRYKIVMKAPTRNKRASHNGPGHSAKDRQMPSVDPQEIGAAKHEDAC